MTSSPSTGAGVLSPEDGLAARAWIADALGEPAETLAVEVVRERAWGDIWRVGGDGGHWFKAPHPRLRREVPLRARLEALAPEAVLPLVAGDADRGWQLTADAGPALAALTRDAQGQPCPALGARHYADLARALARILRAVTADDVRGLGLDEFDPTRAVETFERESAPFRALPADHLAHCGTEDMRRATSALSGLVGRWEAAGGADLSLGLDHNDAHAGNAFLRGGRVLVSDWGDALWSHPFASLRAMLVPLRNVFGPEAMAPVRRAYLEGFADGGLELDQLGELLDLAMMLAVPNRLNAWRSLEDTDAWAEYPDWVTPLWREAGTPIGEVTAP
ncbi:hypothetical protein [Micrococcus sp.]|uniref:hypothetical protein n=1 Tax=Micrococcus sp. TaxID=1271 RepID=UPI0026DB920D|nr:hypothetical protein [Micrococcus sp.]MDO4239557.1 hypothetical protein [Micrococcus sp.]